MAGKLSLALTSDIQQLRYQGEKVKFQGQLKGQQLTVSELDVVAFEISRRLNWWGNLLCRSCRMDFL